MDARAHWEGVYTVKAPTEVSWYRPHLETSLGLIQRVAPAAGSRILDVGGGASTLPDDLLALGYAELTVLDLSARALETARQRLGAQGERVTWLAADVTRAVLPESAFDVWHDRAVFHFLTQAEERARYVEQVRRSVWRGGHVILGTFGPDGPAKCSGLDVIRYDEAGLHGEFGGGFRLVESVREAHQTPFGTTQQFVYCMCAVA